MRKSKSTTLVIKKHPGTTLLGLFTLLTLGLYLATLAALTAHDLAQNSSNLATDHDFQIPIEETILTAGTEQPTRF